MILFDVSGLIVGTGAEAASFASAIRTARGVVEDFGEEAVASSSGGLVELSQCRLGNSERDGGRVIRKKFGLALPIEFSTLKKTAGISYKGELAMLKLKSWLAYIVSMNVFHLLCGLHSADQKREKSILTTFWSRFRKLRPTHPMWARVDAGLLDISRCAPLVCHGDEGRGRKRAPFLVISWSSVLGFGTEAANASRPKRPYNLMRLNYTGSTYLTRMVTAALPKMTRDSQALHDILKAVALDANEVLQQGICNDAGEKFYAVCINCVGDWQWLSKCGYFLRSYSNINKRPMNAKSKPRGICHLCLADQPSVRWENYRVYDFNQGAVPTWYATLHTVCPWNRPSPLASIGYIPGEEASFWQYDLFHSYHLGVGKTLGASCIALMSETMGSSNIEGRLEEVNNLYIVWADEHRQKTYLQGFTKANLGWPDTGTFPNGQWSKGHVSTVVVNFFIHWAQNQDFSHQELLQLSLDACCEISKCLDGLYKGDVWLQQPEALRIANHGMKFLDLYRVLAHKCYLENKALYAHMPKGHALDHIFLICTNQLLAMNGL